jgi:hypothetical protein
MEAKHIASHHGEAGARLSPPSCEVVEVEAVAKASVSRERARLELPP